MKPSLADFQSWYRSEYDWEIYERWAEGVSESAQVWTKYLPADRWLIRDFRRALNLGLHQVDGLKILDIACGPGHMGTVAKYLGHSYVGLDLPHEPILNGIQEFLEVQVILQAVQPLGHLPPPRLLVDLTSFIPTMPPFSGRWELGGSLIAKSGFFSSTTYDKIKWCMIDTSSTWD